MLIIVLLTTYEQNGYYKYAEKYNKVHVSFDIVNVIFFKNLTFFAVYRFLVTS